MTDEMMALRAVLEKSPDADVLREMIGFRRGRSDDIDHRERLGQLTLSQCRRDPLRAQLSPPGEKQVGIDAMALGNFRDRGRWIIGQTDKPKLFLNAPNPAPTTRANDILLHVNTHQHYRSVHLALMGT